MPRVGLTGYSPGEYRDPVRSGYDWVKNRALQSVLVQSLVVYSPMDTAARARVDEVLRDADPTALAALKTHDFTQYIATLYAQLDYRHPFLEGNSRTLREFTRQLAAESGFTIQWERFNRSSGGRDTLYIARDLSVNAISLTELHDADVLRQVQLNMDRLGQNRGLPDLLRDVVRPSRAIAFETLPIEQAVRKHPELEPAANVMRLAATAVAAKIETTEGQRTALQAIHARVLERLNQGEVSMYNLAPSIQRVGRDRSGPDRIP